MAAAGPAASPVLTFDDTTGAVIDLDLRGSPAEILARLGPAEPPRGRGRPKLGVVAREVTLLPRPWDWLAAQRGGASPALRRLVEEAMRADGGRTDVRLAQEAAYRAMSALAGDLPGFEEAARALFAADRERFAAHAAIEARLPDPERLRAIWTVSRSDRPGHPASAMMGGETGADLPDAEHDARDGRDRSP